MLWLTKRFVDDPDSVRGACKELAEYVMNCGYISHFTQKAMLREVVNGFEALQNSPLTQEQEQKGRELLAQIEAMRLERMRASLPVPQGATTIPAA